MYTAQHRTVLGEVEAAGRYVLRDLRYSSTADCAAAYAWLGEQMRLRTGAAAESNWPIWGWSRVPRAILADLLRDGEDVLLRLEVPAGMLLESNFDAWHAALNGDPLYPPDVHPDTPEWDAWQREAERLVEARDHAAIRATWAEMFDLTAWPRTAPTQAVLPEIRSSWITRVFHHARR